MADWEDVNDPAEIRKVLGAKTVDARNKVGGSKQSVQSQNYLNDLSTKANSAAEVGKLYDRAEGALRDLRPGPYRNSLLLAPSIPEDGGGIMDKLGAFFIGGPARLTGAVTPREVSSYQTARAIQNAAVLERQLPQKGPQTESDAARMMLADISPGKGMEANMGVIKAGREKIQREQARSIFYTQFANKWGLNGTSPHGYTADQIWTRMGPQLTQQILGKKKTEAPSTGIRVISRTKVR